MSFAERLFISRSYRRFHCISTIGNCPTTHIDFYPVQFSERMEAGLSWCFQEKCNALSSEKSGCIMSETQNRVAIFLP